MLTNLQKEFSIKEFQDNFDTLMSRVESGETFTIYDGPNRVLIMPIDQFPQLHPVNKVWRASD
jgi:hypothetical protein